MASKDELRARIEELEQDKIRLNRGHDAMAIRLTQTEQALQQTARSLTAARDAQQEAQRRTQQLQRELAAAVVATVGEFVTVTPVEGREDRLRVRVRGSQVSPEITADGLSLEFTPAAPIEDEDGGDDDDRD